MKLEKILTTTINETNEIHKDVIAKELFEEISLFKQMSPISDFEPLSILNYLSLNNLLELYPNLVTALQIVLTLPVSVASGEGSFSKLKIIKNYLRSTMSQERLNGLATISIENDFLDRISTEKLAMKFAQMKVRRQAF